MQKVRDIMTPEPAYGNPETDLQTIARMMADYNCGEIPIVDSDKRPVGVITDRDITCRAVAQGRNPFELKAKDCMSSPPTTVTLDTNIEECCKTMESHQIRRVPVIDKNGKLCGIIAQADLALKNPKKAAEVVKEVSKTA